MATPPPPGPSQAPLLQIVDYLRDPYSFLEKLQRSYGDVFTTYLPSIGRCVVVGSPEGMKQMTSGSYESYERLASGIRYMVGPHAVLFQEGAPHRRLRKVFGPALQGGRMRAYGPFMLRATDDLLSSYRHGGVMSMESDMREITSRVITHCIFGMNEGARSERLRKLSSAYAETVFSLWAFTGSIVLTGPRFLSLLERLGETQRRTASSENRPLSRWPVLSQADRLGAMDAILFEEIDQCRRERGTRTDILGLLSVATDEEGRLLSHAELRDQLLSLLLGGQDTIGTTLCWALYHLAKHPEICAKVREEETQVFPAGFDPLRADDLPYLSATLQESMRLTPTVVGMARKLKHDMVIDGYAVPAGTNVVPAAVLAQRHPRVWDEPMSFRPERFLNKKAPISAHFPFGAGVWRCVGAAFSEYEMRVVLARIVERFDLHLDAEGGAPMMTGITILPSNKTRIRLIPRHEAAKSDRFQATESQTRYVDEQTSSAALG